MPLLLTFKAKLDTEPGQHVVHGRLSLYSSRVKVPTFNRTHCNMQEWRTSRKYGAYANSDLFPNILARLKREQVGEYLYLEHLPANVTVDTSGFLACVTIEVQQ